LPRATTRPNHPMCRHTCAILRQRRDVAGIRLSITLQPYLNYRPPLSLLGDTAKSRVRFSTRAAVFTRVRQIVYTYPQFRYYSASAYPATPDYEVRSLFPSNTI